MSKGAFTIIDSYLGKQELALTASAELLKRLQDLNKFNLENGDWTDPADAKATFVDISNTHMLFVKRTFKPFVAFAYEYFKSTSEIGSGLSLPEAAEEVVTTSFNMRANNGDFIHDQVARIVLSAVGDPNASANSTRYRYTDMPGIRLFKKINWFVDQAVINSYEPDDVIHYKNTRLSGANRKIFETMTGQQETYEGVVYHPNRNIDQVMHFRDGAQTFKPYQPELEIWIPLIFDHNLDVGRSLYNRIIGSQQVYFEFILENVRNIIQASDANGNILTTVPQLRIKSFELYTKNIYLNPEINDLFTERKSLSLLRIYKKHKTILSSLSNEVLLASLKYPIELMHFGFRPIVNSSVTLNPKYSFKDWHKFSVVTRKCVPVPALIDSGAGGISQKMVVRTARYTTNAPTVQNVGFIIHGNTLYPLTPQAFFEKYQPLIMPGLYSSNETGDYLISFCHYPTLYTPSGHVNNSTARELYITYDSTYITPTNRAELLVSAQCINFLIHDNGSIKLKYIA